jgi:hypothetical protein
VTSEQHFWVIRMLGAYEGGKAEDNDPDVPDGPDGPMLGNAPQSRTTTYVFDETVRDYRDDLASSRSDVIPIDTAVDRASAHEALHRFVGNHIRPIPTPPGPADEGIMQNALVVFTTADDFTLTDAQIRAVQRLRNPK